MVTFSYRTQSKNPNITSEYEWEVSILIDTSHHYTAAIRYCESRKGASHSSHNPTILQTILLQIIYYSCDICLNLLLSFFQNFGQEMNLKGDHMTDQNRNRAWNHWAKTSLETFKIKSHVQAMFRAGNEHSLSVTVNSKGDHTYHCQWKSDNLSLAVKMKNKSCMHLTMFCTSCSTRPMDKNLELLWDGNLKISPKVSQSWLRVLKSFFFAYWMNVDTLFYLLLSSGTIINSKFRNNVNIKLSKSRTIFSKFFPKCLLNFTHRNIIFTQTSKSFLQKSYKC